MGMNERNNYDKHDIKFSSMSFKIETFLKPCRWKRINHDLLLVSSLLNTPGVVTSKSTMFSGIWRSTRYWNKYTIFPVTSLLKLHKNESQHLNHDITLEYYCNICTIIYRNILFCFPIRQSISNQRSLQTVTSYWDSINEGSTCCGNTSGKDQFQIDWEQNIRQHQDVLLIHCLCRSPFILRVANIVQQWLRNPGDEAQIQRKGVCCFCPSCLEHSTTWI